MMVRNELKVPQALILLFVEAKRMIAALNFIGDHSWLDIYTLTRLLSVAVLRERL
jgi:hypothetical protein